MIIVSNCFNYVTIVWVTSSTNKAFDYHVAVLTDKNDERNFVICLTVTVYNFKQYLLLWPT